MVRNEERVEIIKRVMAKVQTDPEIIKRKYERAKELSTIPYEVLHRRMRISIKGE